MVFPSLWIVGDAGLEKICSFSIELGTAAVRVFSSLPVDGGGFCLFSAYENKGLVELDKPIHGEDISYSSFTNALKIQPFTIDAARGPNPTKTDIY